MVANAILPATHKGVVQTAPFTIEASLSHLRRLQGHEQLTRASVHRFTMSPPPRLKRRPM